MAKAKVKIKKVEAKPLIHPNHLLLGIALGAIMTLVILFAGKLLINQLFHKNTSGQSQYLYLQQAASGTFTPVDGQKDTYILALTNISPRTAYYTDRPNNVLGTVSSEKFLLSTWNVDTKSTYEKDPPNAALTATNPSTGAEQVMAVELMNPQYSFTSGTLSYTVKALDNKNAENLSVTTNASGADFPAKFSSPVLYIDIDTPSGNPSQGGNSYQFNLDNLNR